MRVFFSLLGVLAGLSSLAQSGKGVEADCRRMLAQAKQDADSGRYAAAIHKLSAVTVHCPDSAATVNQRLLRIYTDINTAKENEKSAKIRAVRQARIAEAGRLAAESQNNMLLYPASVPLSADLAVRSLALLPSPEGDRALRALLEVMATLKRSVPFLVSPNKVVVKQGIIAIGGLSMQTTNDELFVLNSNTGFQFSKKDFKSYNIVDLVMSDDGHYLAVTSYEFIERIFRTEVLDLGDGSTIFTVVRASHFGSSAFSPDKLHLAIAEMSGKVLVYDIRSKSAVDSSILVRESDGFNRGIGFSPDGRYLVNQQGNILSVWSDWLSDQPVAVFTGKYSRYACNPPGTLLALTVNDTLKIYNLPAFSPVLDWQVKDLRSLIFNSAGQLLTFDRSGDLETWEPGTGRRLSSIHMGTNDLLNEELLLADHEHALITTGRDDGRVANAASLRDLASGKELARFYHDQYIRAISAPDDGHPVITVGNDHQIRFWGRETERSLVAPEGVSCFNESKLYLAIGISPNRIRVLGAGRARELTAFAPVKQLRFSADGQDLLVLTKGGMERWHHWKDSLAHRDANGFQGLQPADGLSSFDQNGRTLAVADGKGKLYILSTSDRTIVKTIPYHNPINERELTAPLATLCVSPRGRYAALALSQGIVLVSIAEGRQVKFIKQSYQSTRMAFSPDEEKLYFIAQNKPTATYQGPYPTLVMAGTRTPLNKVLPLPDGFNGDMAIDDQGKLLSIALGKLIRVYDLPQSQDKALHLRSEIKRFKTVMQCAFSPGGKALVSCYGSQGDQLLFSLLEPADLIQTVKNRLGPLAGTSNSLADR